MNKVIQHSFKRMLRVYIENKVYAMVGRGPGSGLDGSRKPKSLFLKNRLVLDVCTLHLSVDQTLRVH